MTVAVIVQARLGSTRLPAKVLLPLPTGRAVLEEVLLRCRKIPGVDVIVCAIPDTVENDILLRLYEPMKHISEFGFQNPRLVFVRGPEHDVLARYAKAAEAVNADVIMRITSDCPLLDPEACGFVLETQQRNGGFVSNSWPVREGPHGHDCEVFTHEALKRAHAEATLPEHREHVTPYMQAHEQSTIIKSMIDRSHLRWTLDTLEDYSRIWKVMEEQMREAA